MLRELQQCFRDFKTGLHSSPDVVLYDMDLIWMVVVGLEEAQERSS